MIEKNNLVIQSSCEHRERDREKTINQYPLWIKWIWIMKMDFKNLQQNTGTANQVRIKKIISK